MLSRLPNATMRYFARLGRPSLSYFIVLMAIVGRYFVVGVLIFLKSCSDITFQHGRLLSPSYSSKYALSHISLSFGLRVRCCNSVESWQVVRSVADI